MVGEHVVTVAGTDLSCLIDDVSITHGRDDPGSQPDGSSCTVTFTATPDDPLPPAVDVGATLVVTTTTPGGTFTRFAGRVTDLALGWDDAGESTPDAGIGQIVAVGPLADLGRRVVGAAPFPLELDGARVARVLAAAGMPLDPLTSDPGTVQILPRDVDSQPALDVARAAAVDATGILWQTRDGSIRYADADHRRGAASALSLDACDVLVTPTWRRDLDGLVNEVSIGYGAAPDGGEQPRYTAAAPDSVTRWGRYGYTSATELAELEDAAHVGDLLLSRNSAPVWVMANLPVDVPALDQPRYDALLGLDLHSLVTLTGLPSLGTAPTAASLWVEGWKETLTAGGHDLELVVSGYCRTVPPPRWDDVDPSWAWGDRTLTEQRRNLLANPSFETGLSGWAAARGTISKVALAAPGAGASCMRYTSTDLSAPGYVSTPGAGTAAHPYPPNAPVLAGYSVRGQGANRDMSVQIYEYDSAGVLLSPQQIYKVPAVPQGVWTRVERTFTTKATTAYVRILVGFAQAAAVGNIWDIDACYLGAPGAYFDGDTPDTSATDYAWTGTPHASASTQSAVMLQPGGLPPELTWDAAACLGPPVDVGRWNDQPATLRWDQSAGTWDTYANTTG